MFAQSRTSRIWSWFISKAEFLLLIIIEKKEKLQQVILAHVYILYAIKIKGYEFLRLCTRWGVVKSCFRYTI